MKKLLLILLFCIFGIASDMPLQNITKENLDSFKELIGLKDDMDVFYVMHGVVDGKEQDAYLEIYHEIYNNELEISFRFADNGYRTIGLLDSKDLSFGIDNGKLIVSGTINPEAYFGENGSQIATKTIDFHLTQDSNAKINKIYFVESKKEEVFKNENGGEFTYSSTIRKPIILDSTLPNVDKLNKSISNATSVDELRQELDSIQKKLYDDYGSRLLDMTDVNIIGYIDDNILEVDTYSYTYEGGAHGVYDITSELYDRNTGEQITGKPIQRQSYGAYWLQSNGFNVQGEDIPDSIWEVFDINDKNKEAFLALLGSYTKQEHLLDYEIYHDVSNDLPDAFSLRIDGIYFKWYFDDDTISLKIPYDDIDEIMDYMRGEVLKDYINAIIARQKRWNPYLQAF